MGLSDEASTRKIVLIRADANGQIGSGHVMRCSAIAQEIRRLGGEVLFAVSNEPSACFVRSLGFLVRVLQGDPLMFTQEDASRLTALASEINAECILVDSYAVTNAFFDGLSAIRRCDVKVAYVDDLFTFEVGCLAKPRLWDVDIVVNYSFSASVGMYADSYCGSSASCLIGPAYAPIRRQFRHGSPTCSTEIRRILVTSGSTNQDELLESLVDVCLEAAPWSHITVVVGKMATYKSPFDERVNILHDVTDMATLMQKADIALSAAGSTLYELASMGVPTIAVTSTDNQSLNAEGFEKLGLGPVVRYREGRFADTNLRSIISGLVEDSATRAKMSERSLSIVDGRGAERIAQALRC